MEWRGWVAWVGRSGAVVAVTALAPIGCVATDPLEVVTTTETGTTTTDPSTSTTDASSSSSTTESEPMCGDGVVDEGEQCDDGPDNDDTAACLPDCTEASCGDGNVQAGVEECDDGNDDDSDSCTSQCVAPSCGDGSIQGDEECDDGDSNGDSRACRSDCTAAICGDGDVHAGEEQCDDANGDNNDGCSELCLFTDCGDGFWNPEINEICDDGPGTPGDACNDDCLTWGLWTQTFDGSGSSNDLIYGVAFDSTGNPIVAGVTLPGNGNGDDIWVRQYDATGGTVWTETVHALTADIGYGVAVAPNDDIFVVGSVFTASDNRDVWMGRFANDGTPGLTRTHNGMDGEADEGLGIAVDAAGNIGVIGYVTQGGDRDIFIRVYSPAGTTQWTVVEAGAGGGDDEGHGVAFDSAGNLVATGFVSTGGGGEDIWVGKYDTGGNESWTRTHAGAAGNNDGGEGVASDSGDNVIVAGFEAAGGGQGDNAWIRKYDADGNEQWTETFNGPSNGRDRANAVAIAGNDEVVVAGSTFATGESDNVWLRRYDSGGTAVYPWTTEYNSPGFQSDVAQGVAVDGSGNVAVGGFETRSENGEARNTWLRYVTP